MRVTVVSGSASGIGAAIRARLLREGQRVTFEIGQGPKGPRAENVKLA